MNIPRPSARLYRRIGRYLVRGLAILLSLAIIGVIGLGAAIILYGQQDHAVSSDVIIVLGAGTRANGSASPAYTRRIRHAISLYERGLAPYILCTGGYGYYWKVKTEAQACAELLTNSGVPSTAILLEEKSASTEENAIYARQVMDTYDLHSAILVSDDFHLLRAAILFQLQGVTVHPSAAQLTSGPLRKTLVVSSTLREIAALGWQVVKSVLNLPYTATPL